MKSFIFKITLFIFIWIIIYSVLYILIPRKFYSRDDYEVFMTVSNKRKSGGIHGNILIGDSKPLMGINAKALETVKKTNNN